MGLAGVSHVALPRLSVVVLARVLGYLRQVATITKHEVMPILLEACPSFREPWQAYLTSAIYEAGLLYVDLGEFACHLVELLREGALQEFPAVFNAVESLHVDGDAFVKEAATIGLLEGIQNVAGNTGVDPAAFVPFLRPETAYWWEELNGFWDGVSPYVGAGTKPEK
jgi:hypothetical protein